MTRSFIIAVLLTTPACAVPDDSGGGGTATEGTASSPADAGECSPGTEACECIEGGLCVEGLVCASNLCVDVSMGAGEETGGPKPEDSDTTGGEDDGGPVGSCEGNCAGSAPDGDGHCYCVPSCEFAGDCCPDYEAACPGECIFSSSCEPGEVCAVGAGTCVPAYEHTYEVRVDRWEDHTPDCFDTALDGDCLADVYFRAFYGTQGEVYRSMPAKHETQSATWAAEPFDLAINSTDALQIVFYDYDALSDPDATNSVCFSDGGVCGPVAESYLHDGGAIWDLRDNPDPSKRFFVQVSFTAK